MALAAHPYLKFNKAANRCQNCNADLANRERHPSRLPADEAADDEKAAPLNDEDLPPMHREDYCAKCWDNVRQEGYFSFWLARRKPDQRGLRQERRARKARLLDLLDRLERYYTSADPSVRPNIDDFRSAATDAASQFTPPFNEEELRPTRLFLLTHLLVQLQVLQYEGNTTPDPDDDSTLLFSSPTLRREFRVQSIDLATPAIEQAQAEINHYLDTAAA